MTRRLACTLTASVLGAMALSVAPVRGMSERVVRAALPPGAIKYVLVIDLENEDFANTFAPNSPAVYLNSTLLRQGELVVNYYATSHASTGNYLSQVSGQASTPMINSDCIDLTKLPQFIGGFKDVTPGTDALDEERYPGQVVGTGGWFRRPRSAHTAHARLGTRWTRCPALDRIASRGECTRRTWGTIRRAMEASRTRWEVPIARTP